MSAPFPLLADFDPGPEIRRSVRAHARHRPRLAAAARDFARFAALGEAQRRRALAARLEPLRRGLWGSPFHRARLRAQGLSPDDLRTLDDLAYFPRLDRATLGLAFSEIPALGANPGRLFVERSSGSTGRPIAVLKEDYDSVHMWAAVRFWLGRLGRRLPARPRVALLCTLPHGVEYETLLPALAGGTLARISIARERPWERLRALRPHLVCTDPAGLHWLLGRPPLPAPRLVLSSALHLSPALRRRAEGALRAPVVNYYSTAETGPLAWECCRRGGRFHVLLPDVWVESLDGELAVTRLRASVLPLLRYLPGDRGELREERCVCGHDGPTICGLVGRRACAFETPAGEAVDAWQLAWAFQHHPLDAFRLTQEGPEAFLLETAEGADGAALEAVLPRLHGSLVALGWPAPRIESRRVARAALLLAKPEPFVRREPLRATPGRRKETP